MPSTRFHRIGVVGSGQMGSGIAQVCASNGYQVVLVDQSDLALQKAESSIRGSLEKLKQKKQIDQEAQRAALDALLITKDWQRLRDCDFIIEAIIEDEAKKSACFRELDQLVPSEAILASNTSSISITKLAGGTLRPDRFIGMHFMNPVPLMKLVEIIPGMATSAATLERVTALAASLGKETTTSQDYPGFVVNRILMPMINEAFTALMEGVAKADDIDKGMKLGTNQPMGPLALADFIGLDTCLAIMRVLHNGLGDPRYRPCPLLIQYVDAGYYGRKSGRGVYEYGSNEPSK